MDINSFVIGYKKGKAEAVVGDPQVDKYFSGEPAFLTLPNATKIAESAFSEEERGWENLVGIQIPKVEKIENYAFYECIGLKEADMPSVTEIGDGAFEHCYSLELSELPSGLESIGSYAFYDCSEISVTELPKGLKIIGGGAFRGCSKIAITEIPSGITWLNNESFAYCTGLKTITFKGHPFIYPGTFTGCTNLTVINVPWSEEENSPYYPPPWGATAATINYNYKGD